MMNQRLEDREEQTNPLCGLDWSQRQSWTNGWRFNSKSYTVEILKTIDKIYKKFIWKFTYLENS
jgi:hypothetical protein